MKFNTKDICVTAIGIALFVVFTYMLRVPVFENYYVCLGYVVMAVWLYSVGTVSGTLVGCIGTAIYCVLISGLRGMSGWVLGNIVIGVMLGAAMKILDKNGKKVYGGIILSITIIVSVAIGILGVKSLTECLLYSQPFFVRVATNFTAFVADVVTLIISIPLCYILDKHIRRIIEADYR